MRIPDHSPWLPGHTDVTQTVLIILTTAGFFPDRPHICVKMAAIIIKQSLQNSWRARKTPAAGASNSLLLIQHSASEQKVIKNRGHTRYSRQGGGKFVPITGDLFLGFVLFFKTILLWLKPVSGMIPCQHHSLGETRDPFPPQAGPRLLTVRGKCPL